MFTLTRSDVQGMILTTELENGRIHRQLVGVCSTRYAEDDDDECLVETLGIATEMRKRNLGKRLLLASIARTDASYCSLNVRCSNVAATGLYLSIGFTVDEVVPDYYENPSEDAFRMVMPEETLLQIKTMSI